MLLLVMLVPPTVRVKLSLLSGASFALLTTVIATVIRDKRQVTVRNVENKRGTIAVGATAACYSRSEAHNGTSTHHTAAPF